MPHHPEVGQREQREELGRVFQPAVAHLDVAELAFDDAKRVLDLGPDAGLDLLQFIHELIDLAFGIELGALTRAHGDIPAHGLLGIRAFVRALVAGIAPSLGFFAVLYYIPLV